MIDFIRNLFRPDFMPHGYCFLWRSDVLWLTIFSDSLIFLAYLTIPLTLIHFVRHRKDMVFNWVFYMFAAFIILCGLTHAMSILTLWFPIYRADAVLKLCTGLVSVATSILLFRLMPAALSYPSPADLAVANAKLSDLNSLLEHRIEERTSELAIARDAALEANKAKSLFLAMMSHEIRTPLNGIIGATTLLRETRLAQAQRELLDLVRLSGDALLTVINDILDFSKIEAGKLDLDFESFELRRAVDEAVALTAPAARNHSLDLRIDYDPALPTHVVGDFGRIRQVLLNLLTNAVKFTREGFVSCHVSATARDDEHVLVRFEVRDTGIGIAENAQRRLFQAFTQADPGLTRRFGGTGLGLTICKRLIELMNGQIHFESKLGKGSCFWFEVEFLIDDCQLQEVDWENVIRNKRVLVVDDRESQRQIVRMQLESKQVSCFECDRATDALGLLLDHAASDEPFAAVLLDAEMPVMDGFMLARAVRSQSVLRRLPIVMLSSSTESRTKHSSDGLLDAILLKPVNAQELYAALGRAILHVSGSADYEAIHDQSRPTERLRVLLAEDNQVNQFVMSKLLEALKCNTLVVSDGAAAVSCFEREPFDLIFMDCQMPELDGYEATRAIRDIECKRGLRRTPIVAVTANAMNDSPDHCFEAGMDDYLSKPIRKDALVVMLGKWTQGDGQS